MNILLYFFLIMAVFTFILGMFMNYGDNLIPTTVLQLFRYGRANKNGKENKIWRNIEIPKRIYNDTNLAQTATESNLVQVLKVVGGRHRSETVDVTTTILTSILFLIHLIRRVYESCFVNIFSGNKMNILRYILAYLHYTGAELSLIAHSVGFSGHNPSTTVTTYSQWELCYRNLTIWHALGIILFVYGSYQQNKAHRQLKSLRKAKKNEAVNYTHRIPYGGLFEKVSCPNYFGEIIIYSSFCVFFQLNNTTWTYVFLWVFCNQITSGVMNHQWYYETFPDYPKDRKAVIPHIW